MALIAWVGAIVLGSSLAVSVRKAAQPAAIIAGTVLVLVFIAVPGRLLGVGSNQIGILDNGIRNEWFDTIKADDAITIDQANTDDWTSLKMEAAEVLRDQSQPTDLIATNLTSGPFVAGVSHLPTYVSAIGYQNDYGSASVGAALIDREKSVWDFINTPNQTTASFLCQKNVRWLWIDVERTEQRSWEPFASPIFQNEEVILAEVNSSLCD